MAMLSGTIDFQVASTPGVMGNVKGGKARLLAVSGSKRLAVLEERGVPGAQLYGADESDGVDGMGAFFLLLDGRGMVERGTGGVIIVASTAGMQPLPYETTYAASKAFALNFSDALHAELRGTGVRLLAVNPGPVPTEWQQVAGYDESTNTMPGKIGPDQVVRESLAAYDKGRRSIIPGRFFRWFMRTSVGPRGMKLRVAERIYRPNN